MFRSIFQRIFRSVRFRTANYVTQRRSQWRAVQSIGLLGYMQFTAIQKSSHKKNHTNPCWSIRISKWPKPLVGRYASSDLSVFKQIFIQEEHSWARMFTRKFNDGLIVDCGANVGFASVFFLRLFPKAHLIAIEPDLDNAEILAENLSAHRPENHVQILRTGLWSEIKKLQCGNYGYRDGLDWGRQVSLASDDDSTATISTTIPEVLALAQRSRINILKIDIEGAEAVVFQSCADWIEKVDAIAIELHDDSHFGPATEVFHNALAGQPFHLSRSGELTVAVREKTA